MQKAMIKVRFARWLFPYGAIRPILFGVCKGMRYEVGPGIGATFCLGGRAFHHRLYEKLIRSGMHVWDLGANTGQSLLALGRLVGSQGSVNAFEPVKELADLACRQVRLNGLSHVHVHCLAASEREGSLEFAYNGDASTQGKLTCVETSYQVVDSSRRMVTAVSLDSFAAANHLPLPDFMKVDVEGAGASVFRGCREVLKSQGPTIFIELHGPEEQQAVRDLQIIGYSLRKLTGELIEDPTAEWTSPIICEHSSRSNPNWP